MTTRSNGTHQGHYTRRYNAGTVRHYAPVLCTVVLHTGETLNGYVWLTGMMYSPDELRTYLGGVRQFEPERWDTLTLAVGPTREDVRTFGLAAIKGVCKRAAVGRAL